MPWIEDDGAEIVTAFIAPRFEEGLSGGSIVCEDLVLETQAKAKMDTDAIIDGCD